jgi:broad specificity phosphatase PhoE
MDARNRDLKKEIKEERLKKRSDPMWFYDEAEESWEAFRRTALPLEREHLEIRRVLRDAQRHFAPIPATTTSRLA